MSTPLTPEYCFERLKEALANKNQSEVEKWDSLLRAENDFRVRMKHREREKKEALLRLAYKESYRITN